MSIWKRSASENSANEYRGLSIARVSLHAVVASCALLASACGGSSAKAESPAAEPSSEAEGAETSSAASKDESAAEASPETTPSAKPEESSARTVLLHEGTAFLLNHEKSDIGIKANEACEKRSKGDLAKKANCSSNALNSMKREGFMLEAPKESDDEEETKESTWIYVGFNIEKGVKVETNRVEVTVAEGSGSTLTIKTSGPDRAKNRKGTVPSEITFTVPDEYTVIVNDSARGKLVYEPKLGLFAE
jgi:hypothetical protein